MKIKNTPLQRIIGFIKTDIMQEGKIVLNIIRETGDMNLSHILSEIFASEALDYDREPTDLEWFSDAENVSSTQL